VTTQAVSAISRLVVLLIKPSKYDADGYLIRFWKGVLPSNSLAVMHALTVDAFKAPELQGLIGEVYSFDEIVLAQRVRPKKLVRKFLDGRTKVVVGLVGVQTNQFPRACDLAEEFRQAGATVVIGGFHVSGSMEVLYYGVKDPNRPDIPCTGKVPNEIQALMDRGIIVCVGEAEELWRKILTDIVANRAERLYRAEQTPRIDTAPLPLYPDRYYDDFSVRIGTIDTGRGCPFKCSFCTIINVQGRNPRWRNPSAIVDYVRQQCAEHGKIHIFFVDDNFARNPMWENILVGLIALKQEGYEFSFMVEIDLASGKIRNHDKTRSFIEMLGLAGCVQAFIGMETVNPKTLKRVSKGQNRPEHYQEFCDQLHAAGITIHGAYIIGFDEDDYDSTLEAIRTLRQIGVDQASFFCLTPLPGSEDHARAVKAGVWMDGDFNLYDSFQPVTQHQLMTDQQWRKAYFDAWREFYRSRYMIEALKRCGDEIKFWGLVRNFFWYRNSALGHKIHPMICGFLQIRTWRSDRRHGYPVESILTYIGRELWRYTKYFGHCWRELYIMQHVYFQAKLESKLEQLADQLARDRRDAAVADIKANLARRLSSALSGPVDWYQRTFGPVPATRVWLNEFWKAYGSNRWNLIKPWYWHWHVAMLPHAATEVVFTVRWFGVLIKKLGAMRS